MKTHEWFIDRRVEFATRTLEPGDERTFADHLVRCEECRREVAALERDLGMLPMAVAPVTVRPGFRWQVAAAVLGEKRRTRWTVWAPLLAAAAVVAVAVGAVQRTADREARLTDELNRSRTALVALGDTVAVLRRAARILQASIQMENHSGSLLIFADDVTHRWNVVLHGLPPAPPGAKYQFWFVCEDGMVRSAELTPTGDGSVMVTLGMPETGGGVLGAALSVEPMDNSSNTPAGRELAHLML